MKKIIVVAVVSLIFCSATMARKGIPVPYCSNCEYFTEVADLLDNDDYYSEEYGGYFDLSYRYEQFWAVWIPIWNSNGEYCLTIDGLEDTYFEITQEELDLIASENNLKLSSNPIPFWDKIGGKLVIGLIVIGGIWLALKKSGDGDKETSSTN